MKYKVFGVHIVYSVLIASILSILLYKIFLGISVYCALYVFFSPWYMAGENYLGLAICLVFFPYIIYLWKKKVWILGVATFFLSWIASLVYFQFIKYDDAASIGVDCFVVQKGTRVGVVDKWGHAITEIDFDGYVSCSRIRWKDSTVVEKPGNTIGILLRDRTFYAIDREARVHKANQIREIKSPFPFKDVRTNAYRIEDYCINYKNNDDVFGYIVYESAYDGSKNWYRFFNQEGQFIAGGEEFVLNNEGTLSLKRGNKWFDYIGHIYKEESERQTYVFDLGEEHGGKYVSRFDDFSDDVIDLSSFLPVNYGDHSYMLVGN